jgi:hypothetical protein
MIECLQELGILGPCAKQTVTCTITTVSGETMLGENWCSNPQDVCPRAPGEDYTKCKVICHQHGHAETEALKVAGDRAKGGTARIKGHTYFCMDCQHALFNAGIINIGVENAD